MSDKDVTFSVNGDTDSNAEPAAAVQISVGKPKTSTGEVRTIIIWCEKIEDKDSVPWGELKEP